MHSTKKRWDGIRTAREHLQVTERTVWRELAERVVWCARGPAPAAPELDRERTLRIFAANIRIAEDSGNRRAAKFLRRQLRKFETRDLG